MKTCVFFCGEFIRKKNKKKGGAGGALFENQKVELFSLFDHCFFLDLQIPTVEKKFIFILAFFLFTTDNAMTCTLASKTPASRRWRGVACIGVCASDRDGLSDCKPPNVSSLCTGRTKRHRKACAPSDHWQGSAKSHRISCDDVGFFGNLPVCTCQWTASCSFFLTGVVDTLTKKQNNFSEKI